MDEFSFPALPTAVDQDSTPHLPFPHFASSPVWFVHHHRPPSDEPNPDTKSNRFPNKEERMDMLWEDFNEELSRIKGSDAAAAESESDSDDVVEFCCMRASEGSGLGLGLRGSLLHHRRPSLVVILKVLKKLFFIQKTTASRSSPFYKI